MEITYLMPALYQKAEKEKIGKNTTKIKKKKKGQIKTKSAKNQTTLYFNPHDLKSRMTRYLKLLLSSMCLESNSNFKQHMGTSMPPNHC